MAVYHPPVGLDLNLQNLRVFCINKVVKRQATLGALSLVQRSVLVACGQLRLHGAPVSGGSVLLSSWATTRCRFVAALTMLTAFAFAGEYATLQIADLTLCQLQFRLQCGIRLDTSRLEFTQNALVAKLAPFETINSFAMRRLPIVCGRLQCYVLLT